MKLSKVAAEQFTAAGVSLNGLLETFDSAYRKRTVTKQNWSESSKLFRGSDSHETSKNLLTDAEEYAASIIAMDQKFDKLVQAYGVESYTIGKAMLDNAVALWPYVAKKPVEIPA